MEQHNIPKKLLVFIKITFNEGNKSNFSLDDVLFAGYFGLFLIKSNENITGRLRKIA